MTDTNAQRRWTELLERHAQLQRELRAAQTVAADEREAHEATVARLAKRTMCALSALGEDEPLVGSAVEALMGLWERGPLPTPEDEPEDEDEPEAVIRATILDGRPDLPLYSPVTAGVGPEGTGVDLLAAERLELTPGAKAQAKTGLTFEIPEGYEAQLRPTNGLPPGITLLGGMETIQTTDPTEDEVTVFLVNKAEAETLVVAIGDRIARLVLVPKRIKMELT